MKRGDRGFQHVIEQQSTPGRHGRANGVVEMEKKEVSGVRRKIEKPASEGRQEEKVVSERERRRGLRILETGERHVGGGCASGMDGTTESGGNAVGVFFACAVSASSKCGPCCRAKYQEMRSSGMWEWGSQVGS